MWVGELGVDNVGVDGVGVGDVVEELVIVEGGECGWGEVKSPNLAGTVLSVAGYQTQGRLASPRSYPSPSTEQ
jgi:hypothetical protein